MNYWPTLCTCLELFLYLVIFHEKIEKMLGLVVLVDLVNLNIINTELIVVVDMSILYLD